MILRRIAQQLKQQHWTGVFIELVIVILGVFIGLQVDNWNQARLERQRLTVLVEAMRADLHGTNTVQRQFRQLVTQGLAKFKEARARRAPCALLPARAWIRHAAEVRVPGGDAGVDSSGTDHGLV